ncbi:toll/interleukin-1 receptor domain-containing protein [Komagataeibacter sp. FNDCR2]|uniref:toll/interleukin-1 receptor domain-containing protein n=1 Tax=Komagataeibacter sp. FNDCR2 TaxID=2878682 RepID=UPI001E3C999F|nr:toll/interleukin-1 receptor domain-containing protein [Komagataeibacter sp. FNDCR2]MCE2576546.1 TIR domain-containing protein [Komagataeibacter sp. FNDCR2]
MTASQTDQHRNKPEMNDLIFISFSSKDDDFARKLVNDIEKRGIRCWISSRDIEPGDDYQSAIVNAMSHAAAMLLLFSSHANSSKEIVKELALASQRSKPVIPARIEDILPTGAFEYQITNAQFIDLFRNYDTALDRLCNALKRQVARANGETLPDNAATTSGYIASRKSGNRIALMGGGVAVLGAVVGVTVFLHKPASSLQPVSSARTQILPDTTPSSPPLPPAEVSHPAPPPTVETTSAPPAPARSGPAAIQQSASPSPASPKPATDTASTFTPLIEQLIRTNPSMRVNMLNQVLKETDEKLTYDQVSRILHGMREGARSDSLHMLSDRIPTPIPPGVAVSFLQYTESFRGQALRYLDQDLPDTLNGDDVVALLGNLAEGQRNDAVKYLMQHIQTPVTTDQALKILRNTDSFWTSTLTFVIPKLTKPQSGPDLDRLLGITREGTRLDAIRALEAAVPDTLTPAEIVKLLNGLWDFRSLGISILAHQMSDSLEASDVASLLDGMRQGPRHDAIAAITPHIKPGLVGTDAAQILDQTGDFWSSSVMLLRHALAKPQSQASLMALLGDTTGGPRHDTLETLRPFLPPQISAADAQALLRDTYGFYESGLTLLASNLAPMTPAEITQIVEPLAPLSQPSWINKLRHLH